MDKNTLIVNSLNELSSIARSSSDLNEVINEFGKLDIMFFGECILAMDLYHYLKAFKNLNMPYNDFFEMLLSICSDQNIKVELLVALSDINKEDVRPTECFINLL